MDRLRATRFALPVMAMTGAILLVALSAGLVRLGWQLPLSPRAVAAHGPLMIVGVLGTVIGLERAVALARPWAFLAPLSTATAGLSLALGAPASVAGALASAGAVVLTFVLLSMLRREPTLWTLVLAIASSLLSVGCLGWAWGWPVSGALPWWTTWLVLTVAGERLELGRVLAPSRVARVTFIVVIAALVVGVAASARLRGAATLGLAAWLFRFDVARRTVKMRGLPRFVATCLLAGYAWLGLAGALTLAFGDFAAGPRYDAATHALLLGFVFSMIFGHAPTILPAVLGVKLPYHRSFYAPLALLHAGLVLRVAGDLVPQASARAWGGLLNVAAILAFAISSVRAGSHGRHPIPAKVTP